MLASNPENLGRDFTRDPGSSFPQANRPRRPPDSAGCLSNAADGDKTRALISGIETDRLRADLNSAQAKVSQMEQTAAIIAALGGDDRRGGRAA